MRLTFRGGRRGGVEDADVLEMFSSNSRSVGSASRPLARTTSAFYSKAVLSTATRLGVRFSVTVRQDKKIRAAIESIDEDVWAPIPYRLSIPEVSGADVAETAYSCFAGSTEAVTVRLVV